MKNELDSKFLLQVFDKIRQHGSKNDEHYQLNGITAYTDLDGYTLALGYGRDLPDDMFVRVEASYMDLDGATLTNTNDSTKSVTADGITGYGARISIGKSF